MSSRVGSRAVFLATGAAKHPTWQGRGHPEARGRVVQAIEEGFIGTAARTNPILGQGFPRAPLLILVVDVSTNRTFVSGHRCHLHFAGWLHDGGILPFGLGCQQFPLPGHYGTGLHRTSSACTCSTLSPSNPLGHAFLGLARSSSIGIGGVPKITNSSSWPWSAFRECRMPAGITTTLPG